MFGDRRYLPETLRPNQVFDALLDAGLAVATIDYRHALEAPFPAQLHDAKAAVRYLRAHADELGVSTRADRGDGGVGRRPPRRAGRPHRRTGPTWRARTASSGPSSAVDVVVDWYGPADLTTMPRTTLPPPIAAKLPPELRVPPEDQLTRGLARARRWPTRARSPT